MFTLIMLEEKMIWCAALARGVLLRDKKIVRILPEGKHHVNPALKECIKVIPLKVIQENTVGIVTKNGVFSRVLNPGNHFVNDFDQEVVCVVAATIVRENQKGIRTNRGCFDVLLEPGQYFENPALDTKIIVKDVTIIEEGHVGLKCVNGRLETKLTPGVYFENHLLNERITDVNMQVQTKELKAQTIVTKDTVSIQVFSVLVYQIVDAYRAECLVHDIDFSIRETIKTVTHQVLSEADLDSVMVRKRELSEVIKQRVESCCEAFGVQIDRIDIKDIVFGDELKEALTASAIAKRMAESKLINAQAEVNAAKLMRETADLLATDAAMSIRSQETLMSICRSGNAKVYFFGDSNMINMSKDKITREVVKRNEIMFPQE
eukprot:gene23106-29299_t